MSLNRSAFFRGSRASAPFVIVLVPFGMLFGVVATEAGLSTFETMVFSFTVFAGASQLAAVQLMQDQAPAFVVVATALAINLRLLMYSVALAPHLGAAPLGMRAVMAYFLVDHSFAVSAAEFDRHPTQSIPEKVAFFFGSIAFIVPMWFGSSLGGALLGRAIPPEYALDFAVPITFLAICGPMLRSAAHLAAAGVSIALALALAGLPYGTGLLVAAAGAMVTGALVETWQERAGAD